MDPSNVISWLGLLFAGGTLLVGVTVFILKQISAVEEKLHTKIASNDEKLRDQMAALDNKCAQQTSTLGEKTAAQFMNAEQKLALLLEKRDAENSKMRHDIINQIQSPFNKIETRLDKLDSDTARKDELKRIEMHIASITSDTKERFDDLFNKLSILPVIERDIKALTTQIDRMANVQYAGGRPCPESTQLS